MPYHPELHHRCSIRLKGYDYRQASAYFITICTHQRECLFTFWDDDGGMALNTLGCIAETDWLVIPNHFPFVELDVYVIMPNHIHGIIVIAQPNPIENDENVGARHASPLQTRPNGTKPKSLAAIIGSYKSAVTRHINQTMKTPTHPRWQRNYYDHIIRDEDELNRIREYILYNPFRWAEDENHPDQNKL